MFACINDGDCKKPSTSKNPTLSPNAWYDVKCTASYKTVGNTTNNGQSVPAAIYTDFFTGIMKVRNKKYDVADKGLYTRQEMREFQITQASNFIRAFEAVGKTLNRDLGTIRIATHNNLIKTLDYTNITSYKSVDFNNTILLAGPLLFNK